MTTNQRQLTENQEKLNDFYWYSSCSIVSGATNFYEELYDEAGNPKEVDLDSAAIKLQELKSTIEDTIDQLNSIMNKEEDTNA